MTLKNVCVLLPVFNEENTLKDCLLSVKAALPDSFILVVDNNSTDSSKKIAQDLGVTVIEESAQGKGYAVSTGVSFALDKGFDWIAFHDSDNEYSATDLAGLVHSCLKSAPEAPGDVMGVGLREVLLGQVLLRSVVANFIARLALRLATAVQPPSDILTGTRVLSASLAKKAFLTSKKHAFKGFEIETALTKTALNQKALIVEKSVRYSPRLSCQKKIKAWDLFHILKAAWRSK